MTVKDAKKLINSIPKKYDDLELFVSDADGNSSQLYRPKKGHVGWCDDVEGEVRNLPDAKKVYII